MERPAGGVVDLLALVKPFRNQILLALSRADRSLLARGLEHVTLEVGQSIEQANRPIEQVYFPDSGIISVVATWDNSQIGIGLIGREGMSATAVVLGDHRSPNEACVLMAGGAHRISAQRLRIALATSKTLRQRLQRYALAFMTQIAQTAFANGKAGIEVRLARFLLMVRDRQDDDDLRLTHAVIAEMLGVRRSGVTDALNDLERKHLIGAKRSLITSLNRKGLVALAGGLYGVPESEYDRLLC